MNNALKVIDTLCVGNKYDNRAIILNFEDIAKTMDQIEIPVIHHIHGGMYGREITIPKDTVLTGQIYKFDHFDIMISGDITVSTDTGETKRFTGYNCFKGMSGKKRAGYAHEDTTWITFHPFSGKSGEEIQEQITAETFEDLEFFKSTLNTLDYKSMLESIGFDEKTVREQSEFKGDMAELSKEFDHIKVKPSNIEGKGLFSDALIVAGAEICPARLSGKRTIAGRYTNHGLLNNAQMVFKGDDMYLVSNRDIHIGDEIIIDYRDVINNRSLKGDLCQE